MPHRRELSILLTAIILLTGAYSFFGIFHSPQLPFSIQLLDAHTAVIRPAQGIPFPNDLRPGRKGARPAALIEMARSFHGAESAVRHALEVAL